MHMQQTHSVSVGARDMGLIGGNADRLPRRFLFPFLKDPYTYIPIPISVACLLAKLLFHGESKSDSSRTAATPIQ